ncbi:hypothetical protein JTB14_014467 [Gonioctena quinquepunctata]|nr:hypothetical protein JTB14_014467 [Gonioctena quinquepunctata]
MIATVLPSKAHHLKGTVKQALALMMASVSYFHWPALGYRNLTVLARSGQHIMGQNNDDQNCLLEHFQL